MKGFSLIFFLSWLAPAMAFSTAIRRGFLRPCRLLGTTRLLAANNDFEREFTQKQKATSNRPQNVAFSTETDHLQHQQRVFDDMADFFASEEAIPPDVVPILTQMAQDMIQQAKLQKENEKILHRSPVQLILFLSIKLRDVKF